MSPIYIISKMHRESGNIFPLSKMPAVYNNHPVQLFNFHVLILFIFMCIISKNVHMFEKLNFQHNHIQTD